MSGLSAVFRPRAIAVVGASDDPVKIGGRPLAFLLRHGYAGRVFPVNPARATVQGLPAFPSLAAIPEHVDLAIVVVPAERVLESLEAAAAKGARAAIVFSSGFAEVGEAGRVAQNRLRELAERTGPPPRRLSGACASAPSGTARAAAPRSTCPPLSISCSGWAPPRAAWPVS
ncbi:MAG: CoA-binding protein [Candidatus Rokuibacteriota bacterium]